MLSMHNEGYEKIKYFYRSFLDCQNFCAKNVQQKKLFSKYDDRYPYYLGGIFYAFG